MYQVLLVRSTVRRRPHSTYCISVIAPTKWELHFKDHLSSKWITQPQKSSQTTLHSTRSWDTLINVSIGYKPSEITISSKPYMSTRKWIWLISLPNQSTVQYFELSGICFFTIALMYANKGGSKFSSIASKVCFFEQHFHHSQVRYVSSWSIHSRGVTDNRWILLHQTSRDISAMSNFIFTSRATLLMEALSIQIAHGGACNLRHNTRAISL